MATGESRVYAPANSRKAYQLGDVGTKYLVYAAVIAFGAPMVIEGSMTAGAVVAASMPARG